MPATPPRVLDAARSGQDALLTLLRALVECESPSSSKPAVDACLDLAATAATRIGGRSRRHRRKTVGDLLEVHFGRKRPGEKPVLLLGHLDTVWPLSTLSSMPFRIADGCAWGPGVLDMKAGVAMALSAIELAGADLRPTTLLLVSDEEVGSGDSRALTEKLAAASDRVYVLEPAQGPEGAYKTARKGVGQYRLHVEGVAAHSGIDFASGHSAITELAHQIAVLNTFSRPDQGITVNVGVIGGGTQSNVVAARAWAEVDLRVPRMADAARLDRLFRRLRPRDSACSLTVEGGLNRPPMERSAATVRLFREAQKLAATLGLRLEEASTGGGSDGNFTAALGIPTLDGMGAVGEGAHAAHESIRLDQLPIRTALLAALLRRPR